jgi:hypothetical protein
MGRIKLPHVNSFRNRHGTMVFYFRKRLLPLPTRKSSKSKVRPQPPKP